MRHVALCLAATLGAGCFPPVTPAGPKYVKLDPTIITAIDVVLVGGERTFCPNGDAPQIKVVAQTSDGKRIDTWAAGEPRDGKLNFDQFEWSATIGAVTDDGHYASPNDVLALIDRDVTVRARVVGKPDVVGEVTFSPIWTCGAAASFSAYSGSSGQSGDRGRDGRQGEYGNKDKNATDGEDGEDGGDGGDGQDGADAGHAEIALAYLDTERGPLVIAKGGRGVWVFDPKGRPFAIYVNGGSGGSGGRGGDGGRGGNGGSNDIVDGGDGGDGADGGDGGNGGGGGDGGRGGSVDIYYDKRHPELAKFVVVSTAGGYGGSPGSAGYGGSGGSGGSSASGKRGNSGRSGMGGRDGTRRGRDGKDGDGARVEAVAPADLKKVFAKEIADGFKVR